MMRTGADRSRVHVVAGATGRIGSLLTDRLFDEDGVNVVGIARDHEMLNELSLRHGEGFHPCQTDLLNDAAIGDVRRAVAGREVGLLVNATRSVAPGGVEDVTPGDLARAVDLKAGGLLRLVRAADPGLGLGSRVVAVGGRLGYDADPAAAAAGLANAAVALLVRQLAHALGPRGATSHVVAPGAIAHGGDTARYTVNGAGTPHEPEQLRGATPVRRLPTLDDVVWMITMLSQPSAAFLNGGSLIMDGGQRTAVP